MKIKRSILCVMIAAATFMMAGCSSKSNSDEKNNLEQAISDELAQKNETSYFWSNGITDDTIAIIVNKYTDEQYQSIGEPTKVVLQEESKDKILIVSAEDNTNIEIWSVESDGDKLVDKELECQMQSIKKNSVIEIQVSRAETTPAFKIKFSNSKGELEYYLTENLKDGNPDIEYLTVDIQNTNNNEGTVQSENTQSSSITAGMFIPNGKYEIKFNASDSASSDNYINGNGSVYQVIGTSGKGPYIQVYESKDNGLYRVFTGDLTESEMADVDSVNYLDKRDNTEEVFLLDEPISVGTRWDNKEIVEVGENLQLGDLTLNGAYVKTWEKEESNGSEVVKVYYYSEGLGCVEYRVLVDGEVVEQAVATEVISR